MWGEWEPHTFLDRVPTFGIGCANEYQIVDEGWGPRAIPSFAGHSKFSWHLIDTLVENHFDPEIIQEIKVDHGLQVPLELFWGRPEQAWPVKVVPIFVNVLQYPIPLPARLFDLGKQLGRAIENYDSDEKFVVLGTGGLSHQLQGARAGFTNPPADRQFLVTARPGPGRRQAAGTFSRSARKRTFSYDRPYQNSPSCTATRGPRTA